MRNHTKTIGAICVLLGVALTAPAQSPKAVAAKALAIVGEHMIVQSEIDNTLEDMRRSGQPVSEDSRCLLIQQSIVRKLLMLQGEKDSLPVTDEDVEAELDRRLETMISQVGTVDELVKIAGKPVSQIKDDARAYVREQQFVDAMQRRILENVRVTPSEVKLFYDKIPKDSLPVIDAQVELNQIIVYPKPSKDVEQYLVAEMNNYKKQVDSKSISFPELAGKVGQQGEGIEFELNRNSKKWDPAFLSAAFELKDGQISTPVKSKYGYHIIQMVRRSGDMALVRHIFRMVPVSYDDIKESIGTLYALRDELMAKNIDFKEAAARYNEDEQNASTGYYLTGEDGSTFITPTQLDKETAEVVSRLNINELSKPISFEINGRKAVRILYLKSRTQSHLLNLKDDYSHISRLALEEKQQRTIDKWVSTVVSDQYIMVDPAAMNECPLLRKYNTSDQ